MWGYRLLKGQVLQGIYKRTGLLRRLYLSSFRGMQRRPGFRINRMRYLKVLMIISLSWRSIGQSKGSKMILLRLDLMRKMSRCFYKE